MGAINGILMGVYAVVIDSSLVTLYCDCHNNEANLKNIFVSPYRTLFYRYGSAGRKLIFLK